ncbi:MAG: DUF1576 domain-containing protein [Oscillospiraceae bacterium]|jgi:hypothetical protein|nr:DUF1576 domain-containing protein [Oscillospiraceae bacterium]
MPTKLEKNSFQRRLYPLALGFCALLTLLALLLDSPARIWTGLGTILTSQSVLITDYIALAGPGAALLNSVLVVLSSLLVLRLSKAPLNGSTLSTLGLMAGFSLFGKNFFNIWPILLGSFLSAKARHVPFSSCANAGLMASTLGPLVSFVCFSQSHPYHPVLGLLLGVLIGFVVPPLSLGAFQMQRGMNLYNIGFTCGLTAMVLMPVLHASGIDPVPISIWSPEYTRPLGIFVSGLCLLCLAAGFFFSGKPSRQVWTAFRSLLKSSGQAPCDFLASYGGGAVLVNMGLNGLLCLGYLLLIGGDISGPTLGCILTVMGFSAAGKHPRNILPIMAGVALGGATMGWNVTDPASQMAALFGTTLAPIPGCFGVPAGILAGFLHGSVVLRTGGVVGGVNLYNNGFAGGLVALFLTPILSAFLSPKKDP